MESHPKTVTVKLAITLFVGMVVLAGDGLAQIGPSSRLDVDGNLRESAYMRVPLFGADQAYAVIEGERIKALLREVTQISHTTRSAVEMNGNRYWGRIAGTRGEEMAREWVQAKFEEIGLADIRVQEFDLPPQWFPASYDITVQAHGRTYRFDSLVPALRSNPTNGMLELDAVWVGTGSAADFLGRDVRGKAVFIHTITAPGQMGHTAAPYWDGAIQRAQDQGAAAIFLVYGLADNLTIWMGLGGNITVPGAIMGYYDGNVVKDLIGTGDPVRVRMRVDVERREGLKTASVFGTLPGTSNENIYVLAHLDGYFEAASDNASGIAVMMALAEYFASVPQERRRRNLIFVGTAGHHVGSPGSRWMADNRDTALADAVLMINAEHISLRHTINWRGATRNTDSVSPSRWWVNGSDRLVQIVLDSYRTFGVNVWDRMEDAALGEMGSVATYLPSIQIIRSPDIKHSDHDTPDWVPAAGLEATARAYAKIIDEANRLNRRQLEGPILAAQRQP